MTMRGGIKVRNSGSIALNRGEAQGKSRQKGGRKTSEGVGRDFLTKTREILEFFQGKAQKGGLSRRKQSRPGGPELRGDPRGMWGGIFRCNFSG